MTEPFAAASHSPDECAYVRAVVKRIVEECPQRAPASDDERRAQTILQADFERLGLKTRFERFRFNANLYANLALHCGLALLATALSFAVPLVALALHLAVGVSLFLDTTRRAYLLRRLFPFRPSQNLLATLPAQGEPALRIVLGAHADAAPPGLMFHPRLVRRFARARLPFSLERPLAVIAYSQLALAAFDLSRAFGAPASLAIAVAQAALSLPALVAFVLNLEAALRRRVVPGANDDLSGMAALPLLAARLAPVKPNEVELVFAVTGCEEASMGGADALARSRRGVWDPRRTVFVALDCITNGALHYLRAEGDVVRLFVPAWLEKIIIETASGDPRFRTLKGLLLPAGGTDAHAFLAHGFFACSFASIDSSLGTPQHYHRLSDTLENLDIDALMDSIDFLEKLVMAIIRRRLGVSGRAPPSDGEAIEPH